MSTSHADPADAQRIAAFCIGMRRWKQKSVSAFLQIAGFEPHYCSSPLQAVRAADKAGGCVVVWASKSNADLKRLCAAHGVKLHHMEDGFLRSRGLGAHHVEATSLVLDARGIYYDPTGPSDLEHMLEHDSFSQRDVQQARVLGDKIIAAGLSKYNVGTAYAIPQLPGNRTVVLVPGQVADDASLRFGTGQVGSNLSLLKATREQHPDAYIVYKPHPDVEAGKRSGIIGPSVALQYCDFIATGMSSDAAISVCDEVVTMTSLLGFEALIRGKAVTCYGMPFYAGWGATRDHMQSERRTRRRSTEEIMAAAYMKYARYVNPQTGAAMDALTAAESLLD